jgi:integrase
MLEENPVVMLTQLRSWNKLKPKHRVIKKDELARWYRSVQACKSDNLRDSLLLMLFTGLRKSETASLEWKNVDFVDRSFTVVDTKNGKDHCLPMSSFVYDMLWQRHENARCGWVFPNKTINGPMSSTNSTYERIGFKCGITFSPHDLRRSFLLVARTVGLDHYTLKHLLNHAGVRDITFSCYTVRDIENLREPVEKISQAMKFYLGITPEVIPASVLMIDAGGADVPSLELSR